MPRMTWTIEPNPDESVNTTSVFFYPSNVGTVVTESEDNGSTSDIRGIKIDRAVAANATKIGVLIQAPKDGLRSVKVSESRESPFYVNIIKGFTNLRDLHVLMGWIIAHVSRHETGLLKANVQSAMISILQRK